MDSFIQVTYIESIPWPLVSNLVWATGMHTDVLLYVSFRNPCYKADGCDQHYRGACRLVHKHTQTHSGQSLESDRGSTAHFCVAFRSVSLLEGAENSQSVLVMSESESEVCVKAEKWRNCVFSTALLGQWTLHTVCHMSATHTHTHTH